MLFSTMHIVKNIFNKKILLILLLFLIFFPHGNSYYFDGLPFTSKFESFYVLLVLPFFLIFFYEDIDHKLLKFIFPFVFIIKIILIFSPYTGINVNQYFNKIDMENKKIIRSYDSIWNKNITTLQKTTWTTKKEFPIDWKDYGGKKFYEKRYKERIKNIDDFDNINLYYELNFFLKSKKNEKFKIQANGCENSFLEIENLQTKNKHNFLCNEEINLHNGLNKISGYINFKGSDWSLKPLIKKNSNIKYESAFKSFRIFKKNHYLLKSKYQELIKFFSFVFNFVLCFIPLLLLILKFKNNNNFRIYFLLGFSFFIIFFILYYFLINYLNYSKYDGHTGSIISISVLIFTFICLLFNNRFKFINVDNLDFKYLFFLIFAPVTLFFYFKSNIFLLNQIPTIGWDDDWHFFEFFSRSMVVDNYWFLAGEEIVKFRLGIRYIYALSHVIFGMSQFALKMFEPWLIIIAGFYLSKISIKFGLTKTYTFLFCLILFILFMGGNYRWLIGRGLSEFYCLIIIVFSIYLFLKFKLNYKNILLLSIFPIIGTWFREEHVILYSSLIFLKCKQDVKNNFFLILFEFLKKQYRYVLLYWLLLFFGFFLFFTRNYILSGDFGILYNQGIMHDKLSHLNNYSRMLLGNDPDVSFKPNISSIFLMGAFLVSIFCMFQKNIKIINFQIFLPIFVFSILLPYLIANNWAYPPRYTIHYLPFGIIIVLLTIQKFFEKNKLLKS